MPTDQKAKQRRTIIYLVVFAVLVMAVVTVVALRALPPPGTKILGKALPDDHETEACYTCHKGIPSATAIIGLERPDAHATTGCANCHEGYTEPPA